MARIRDKRGFTLIELAIVLVIIGIILGAVIKGQDLIENAKHKKLVAKVKEWENATWTYFDRRGRFPGDSKKNGIIGDQADESVKTDLTSAKFIYPPYEGTTGNETNTITLAPSTFYVFLGYDSNAKKNILALCATSDCSQAFDATMLEYLKAVDASLDGVADGTEGQVVGVKGGLDSGRAGEWILKATDVNLNQVDWTSTTIALLYYFDSKR